MISMLSSADGYLLYYDPVLPNVTFLLLREFKVGVW